MISDRIPSCLVPGATWFFTVNLAERRGNRPLVKRINVLRTAFHSVRARRPFHLEAVVILPDYYIASGRWRPMIQICSTRWSLIKEHFSVPSKKASAFRKAAPTG